MKRSQQSKKQFPVADFPSDNSSSNQMDKFSSMSNMGDFFQIKPKKKSTKKHPCKQNAKLQFKILEDFIKKLRFL